MSILKQVLTDAITALKERPGIKADASGSPATPATASAVATDSNLAPKPPSGPGVTTVILNWNRGENDPFTVFNATMRRHFQACGKNVEVVEITKPDWITRLFELDTRIDFAYTWQGIASATQVGDRGGLWELLRVPLICVHGDHPSQMPRNHRLDVPHCVHLYTNAEFARYSNRHFRRSQAAAVIDIPMLHVEPRLERRAGDYFVIAKNVDDPAATEQRWRQELDGPTFDLHMSAAEALKARIATEAYTEIHEVLDQHLAAHDRAGVLADTAGDPFHQFHHRLDHYLRSHKSILAVRALRDFPLRVYGRGWERVAADAPRAHSFEPGRAMADSQELFYSRYGIVDVSPAKALHDRTRRAMANGGAFLSSANLEDSFANVRQYDPLFYSFMPGELEAKCAEVVRDPDGHLATARRFADAYHDRFHFRDFVNRVDQLARLVDPR